MKTFTLILQWLLSLLAALLIVSLLLRPTLGKAEDFKNDWAAYRIPSAVERMYDTGWPVSRDAFEMDSHRLFWSQPILIPKPKRKFWGLSVRNLWVLGGVEDLDVRMAIFFGGGDPPRIAEVEEFIDLFRDLQERTEPE